MATTLLQFLLVSTKLLLLEECRTSVIKNKNESCFTHSTPRSICKKVCTRMQGCTPHLEKCKRQECAPHTFFGCTHHQRNSNTTTHIYTFMMEKCAISLPHREHTKTLNVSAPKGSKGILVCAGSLHMCEFSQHTYEMSQHRPRFKA